MSSSGGVDRIDRDRTLELVESARKGDRGTFGEITELYRSRLLALIRSRMGRGVRQVLEPEDVLQETFARSWELIARFQWRGEGSFFRWLSAIAEHVVLKASQTSARTPLALDRDVAADGVSPSKALRRDERFERLEESVRSLPPDQRQAIQLARIEGLPVREVAKRMHKSPDAAKKIITRALRRLQDSMGNTAGLHWATARSIRIRLPEGLIDERRPHERRPRCRGPSPPTRGPWRASSRKRSLRGSSVRDTIATEVCGWFSGSTSRVRREELMRRRRNLEME